MLATLEPSTSHSMVSSQPAHPPQVFMRSLRRSERRSSSWGPGIARDAEGSRPAAWRNPCSPAHHRPWRSRRAATGHRPASRSDRSRLRRLRRVARRARWAASLRAGATPASSSWPPHAAGLRWPLDDRRRRLPLGQRSAATAACPEDTPGPVGPRSRSRGETSTAGRGRGGAACTVQFGARSPGARLTWLRCAPHRPARQRVARSGSHEPLPRRGCSPRCGGFLVAGGDLR